MLRRLKVGRKIFVSDSVSGFVLTLITIPGDLANGLLAGVNPVNGLYSLITSMTVASLFTSSVLMAVDSTSATAVAILSRLENNRDRLQPIAEDIHALAGDGASNGVPGDTLTTQADDGRSRGEG